MCQNVLRLKIQWVCVCNKCNLKNSDNYCTSDVFEFDFIEMIGDNGIKDIAESVAKQRKNASHLTNAQILHWGDSL